jgi:hypothetical protein
MVTAARVQDRIYYGYGKAAQRLGTDFTIYRSATAINPISSGNIAGTLKCSFNVSWSYMKANKYANAIWQLVADGRLTQVYDYLTDGTKTFYVAAQQLILPILAIECNQILTVKRPTGPQGVGYQGYSVYDDATADVIYQNCPGSMLEGARGASNPVNIPSDAKMPWFIILLPFLGNKQIQTGDFVTDSNGVAHMVSSAELTDLGWRLTTGEKGA